MTERLIIIGGVAAGMSAASRARRLNPELEIIAYERSGYVSYGACGFPYYLKGIVGPIERLLARSVAEFAEQGVTAHVGHEIREISPSAGTLRVRRLSDGHEFNEPWDKLVIAAGAIPNQPKLPGSDLAGVFVLRTVEDTLAIEAWLSEQKPQRAVIVGAGFIGVEMAEALRTRGIEVTMIDRAPQPLSVLDTDLGAKVAEELTRHGVMLCQNCQIEGFVGEERVQAAIVAGKTIETDMVLLSIGVKPGVELARAAGVQLGASGAIAVDSRQRTNLTNIYAAGDVAEARHRVIDRPVHIPLGTTANKQGRVAGSNAAGREAHFGGIVGTTVVQTFNLEAAITGLSERLAANYDLDAYSVTATASSRAGYMPGAAPLTVRLTIERGTKRLLGAQMVGHDGVGKRIDVIAAALQAGWDVEQLAGLDLSYAPPFAPVWDPILVAANVALRE